MLSHEDGAFENPNLCWEYLKHYYGSFIEHQTRANTDLAVGKKIKTKFTLKHLVVWVYMYD